MKAMQRLATETFEIAYREAGRGGRIAILVHASASSPSQWRSLMDAADSADLDVRFFAPALTGYTGSGRRDGRLPHGKDDVAALDEFVDAVSTSRPVDIVGHSYGGATALRLALSRPDAIRTLTLIEPVVFDVLGQGGDPDVRRRMTAFIESQIARVERGELQGAARDFVHFWSGPRAWERLSDDQRDHFAACMPKIATEWHCVTDARTDLTAAAQLSSRLRLISGALTPEPQREVMEVLEAALPRSTHYRLAGAGHMSPLTHPQQVNPLVLNALAHRQPAASRATLHPDRSSSHVSV